MLHHFTAHHFSALKLVVLYGALACQQVLAVESVRDQEIAQCLPGEISTWGDGRDRPAISSPMVFVYDHSNAPSTFSFSLVEEKVRNAQAAWSQCGVPGRVVAHTSPALILAEVRQGAVRVQWSDAGSTDTFGLANLGQRTLSLSPTWFQTLQKVNPRHDSRETLQMVISHEMGHLYGLMAHSRRCVDVTSNYNNGKGDSCSIRNGLPLPIGVEYRALLPTACDIARCLVINKK